MNLRPIFGIHLRIMHLLTEKICDPKTYTGDHSETVVAGMKEKVLLLKGPPHYLYTQY